MLKIDQLVTTANSSEGVYYSSQAEVVRLEGVTGRSREVTGLEAK